MLKILHTADWHLGSFPAPASKSRQNLRYLDICAYIEFLIEKAKTLQPDITIIAGDIFHQAKTWSDRGLQETNAIVGYISQLADISPVCVLRGTANHDGKMHYDLLSTALQNNNNVYIIDKPCVKNINNLAAVTFVPIFDKNQYRSETTNTLDKEAENNYFCDMVRDCILDLKKEADSYNLPTILVTHYTVLGSVMPNGQTNIFANNEIVIDPLTLVQSDYWLSCLGHIHKPQKLDACPNTFYSGSLCGLTFNDEHDSHGFYMHYITDQKNISSEFIEIPSRRFHTIYLDDVMLSDIINSNYNLNKHITTPMNGDIIRVIYSCSDVTNKALNKSLLETAIYKHTNAFFVQEIIPAEIKITVDKTAMRNTATPIENLRAFLKHEQEEHNSISDAQLNDCIGLAQPIIDRTLANKTNNHNVGVFMPIEIEVKNYRNYKDAVFNYNDVKFCVINGDNGAGKSSLFMDAMLDALFEETREGDITGWINNDINVRSGSIRFTFAIGDNTYRIIRTRQKSGKATLNISQLVTNNTGSQSWVDMSEEKIKDTQAVINRIIGMNAITLKSCGLIMQDAYGLFLQADKNTRMDILGDILELDVYDDLNNAASEFSLTCQRELDKITNDENNINANLADGPEIQKQLTAVVNENNARLQELTNCSNELITCTLKRDAMLNKIESYNRLSADINKLVKKRQDLNFTLEEQNTVLMNAYQIVSGEKAYLEKVSRRDKLIIQEKEMSEKKALIQTLVASHNGLQTNAKTISNIITDANSKIAIITQKKAEIEFQLSNLDDTRKKAALYEQTKAEIADGENKLRTLEDLKKAQTQLKMQIGSCTHAFTVSKDALDDKLNEINKKAQILTESNCPIAETATCRFLTDAQQAVAQIPALQQEIEILQKAYDEQLGKLNAELNEYENQIQAAEASLPDLNLKKQELAVYESCAFRVASVPELQNTLASYAQQLIDFAQIRDSNTTALSELNGQIETNAKKISLLTTEIVNLDKIKTEIASFGDLNEQGNQIAANRAILVTADARIKEITQEIQDVSANITAKTTDRNHLCIDNIAITKINADIMACQTRQQLLNNSIADCGKRIGQLEMALKQYQNDIRRLDQLKELKNKTAYIASNTDWLKKAFCRNGIPHNIIRSIIPVLQITASNILAQMSGNTMSIELRTEKMLTTKKEVATLDVIVCDTITGDLPYLSRSGGERVKAALSVVLALAEIKSSESGTQLGFLFIDEPPFLDSNGIEAYCDALEAIQNRYSNLKIIAITHDPEMKSRFAQSIDVVKTPNGSEIYTNL